MDVVVIGAGIVGAACAYAAAQAGLSVTVVDRGPIAGGTTGAGEGNLLVSDKPPGAELDLALLSRRLWDDLADGHDVELERKGGLVVSSSPATHSALQDLAARQREAGVEAIEVDDLRAHEPHLSPELAGGFLYPQDMQLQPMLAAATMLRRSRATLRLHEEVTGFLRAGERVTGVRTAHGDISAGAVINAAGTWASAVASLAGVDVPVAPRRGFILVTEPLPQVVRHKVYYADYVANVASDSAALQASAVVEGTSSGTVLIGATRERVGFDRTWSEPAIRTLAGNAARLFPFLLDVSVLRAYRGFRPYCPDHLPVIGADPRAPGLFHACGHEGAGIGLSIATGHLLAATLRGETPELDLAPFRPERFAEVAA